MKLSLFGRVALSLVAALALGLSMSACGGGTIAYLWVPGVQYGSTGAEIAGFKVDDFTGNLTAIPHSPFSAEGSTPLMMVVKTGGRYVYVINQGTGGGLQTTTDPITGKTTTTVQQGTSSNVALFSVGGDGTLTFQQQYQTQGAVPMWATFDSTGTFLYVLDKYSPSADGNGAITVFSADATTGRLTLLTNQQSIPTGQQALTYFEVGPAPLMMKVGGSCLYTINSGDQSVTPYLFGSGGQLTTPTTGVIHENFQNITSINGNGGNLVFTDAGANQIDIYTVGTSCGLTSLAGGAVPNYGGAVNPSQSLIDTSGQFLYVLNKSTTSTNQTTPYSSITSWQINSSNGELTPLNSSVPFGVGSGPQCIVEDPTSKYMYISNNDGTITGKQFDAVHGLLSDLTRGSSFPATGQNTCLVISGSVE